MADSQANEASSTSANNNNVPRAPSLKKNKRPVCKFFNTKNGCRAGQDCKFFHSAASESTGPGTQEPNVSSSLGSSSAPGQKQSQEQQRESNQRRQGASRVVARPTPKAQTEDPRTFQVGQIQRRFKPEASESDGSTVLAFKMKPSDPDFPYDIEALECVLSVPSQYPTSGKPSLTIKNKDILRGFQINIEKGFDTIHAGAPEATLLGLMNRLDKQLETILSGKMADTVKIVANKDLATSRQSQQMQQHPVASKQTQSPASQQAPTALQIDNARVKRQSDIRQLEARFGRVQSYAKSADGLTYTLPLDSPKRSTWPSALQELKSTQLIVPEAYPLEQPRLRLDSGSEEARAVEKAFQKRAKDEPNATLTQMVNYVSQHLKDMATPGSRATPMPKSITETSAPVAPTETRSVAAEDEKSHIHHIPRPPEWNMVTGPGDSDDSDTYDSGDETEDEDEENADIPHDAEQANTSAPAERGILLSFPHLELHGIELLELTSLNITVKCERCKDTMDIERLRSAPENSKMREESCKKCASTLAVRFRADLIHANSVRGGYLDLDGCTVIDMLPSSFTPTCSECSTAYPAPGVVAVRGDAAMAICREDHRKMTFRIQEVKFLQISASAMRASRAPGRKKVKENLGIVAGTELPRQGRCTHYRKSYRWFRFSCCQKVFPCDRCHDEQTEHPNEHANRMLCGFCSREQNYRPEDCGICHHALTGKQGRGFWEGGKGTRDPMRMSRKDPRKYKRRPGTKPKT